MLSVYRDVGIGGLDVFEVDFRDALVSINIQTFENV